MELPVRVSPAGSKGLGAFAAEYASARRWVGSYHGECLSAQAFKNRYHEGDPVYGFKLNQRLVVDGRNSTHFTRYINHDEHGNLRVAIAAERIDFFAREDIHVGDELTYDYGQGYWEGRAAQPVAGTDSRALEHGLHLGFSFESPVWLPRQLPAQAPLSLKEASIALALPTGAARAWLVSRCRARGRCSFGCTSELGRLGLAAEGPRETRRRVRRALNSIVNSASDPCTPASSAPTHALAEHGKSRRSPLPSPWAEALLLWAALWAEPGDRGRSHLLARLKPSCASYSLRGISPVPPWAQQGSAAAVCRGVPMLNGLVSRLALEAPWPSAFDTCGLFPGLWWCPRRGVLSRPCAGERRLASSATVVFVRCWTSSTAGFMRFWQAVET